MKRLILLILGLSLVAASCNVEYIETCKDIERIETITAHKNIEHLVYFKDGSIEHFYIFPDISENMKYCIKEIK